MAQPGEEGYTACQRILRVVIYGALGPWSAASFFVPVIATALSVPGAAGRDSTPRTHPERAHVAGDPERNAVQHNTVGEAWHPFFLA